MANRIVLGTQTGYTIGGQHEQGLFISKPGQDVTAVGNIYDLLFSSNRQSTHFGLIHETIEATILSGGYQVAVSWTNTLPYTPFIEWREISTSGSTTSIIGKESGSFYVSGVDTADYSPSSNTPIGSTGRTSIGNKYIVEHVSGFGCVIRYVPGSASGERVPSNVSFRITVFAVPSDVYISNWTRLAYQNNISNTNKYQAGPIHGTNQYIVDSSHRTSLSDSPVVCMVDDGNERVMGGANYRGQNNGSTNNFTLLQNAFNTNTLHLRTDLANRIPVITLCVKNLHLRYQSWQNWTNDFISITSDSLSSMTPAYIANQVEVSASTSTFNWLDDGLLKNTAPNNTFGFIIGQYFSRTGSNSFFLNNIDEWDPVSFPLYRSSSNTSRGPADDWYNKIFRVTAWKRARSKFGSKPYYNWQCHFLISFSQEVSGQV